MHVTPEQATQTLQTAILSHQQGDLVTAESLYDEVIAGQPSLPDAWHMKAQILLGKGLLDEAIVCAKKAVELYEATPIYWTTLANIYLQKQDYTQADDAFKKAIEHDETHAHAWQGLGVSAQEQMKDEAALEALNRALTLDKNLPIAATHRAVIRIRQRKYALAEGDLKHAMALAPQLMLARLYMGIYLNVTGKAHEALRYLTELYNGAYRVPQLYNTYASVQLQLGHLKQAAMLIEEGVRTYPDDMGLHYQRTRMKKIKDDDAYVSNIQNALQTEGGSLTNKYRAAYALASIYENSGRYEESFDVLVRAGSFKRKLIDYDADNIRQYIDDVKAFFSKSVMNTFSRAGLRTKQPIFIVGMPRSGTTLVEQMIATSKEVYGAGELNHLQHVLGAKKTSNQYHNFSQWAGDISPQKITAWAQDYMSLLQAEAGNKNIRFITDKMPSNAMLMGFIRLMFPQAKIVHCVRNGMDTCVSCFQKNFTHGQGFSYALKELGAYYMMHEELMAYWHDVVDSIHTCRYEDLIASPAEESQKLFGYIGLAWDEGVLNFHQSERSVHTASLTQVRQPIYTGSVGKWRRYGEGVRPLADALGVKM